MNLWTLWTGVVGGVAALWLACCFWLEVVRLPWRIWIRLRHGYWPTEATEFRARLR
jgi:hypothetical protein